MPGREAMLMLRNSIGNHMREALIRVRHVKDSTHYKWVMDEESKAKIEFIFNEIDLFIDHITTPA